MKIENRNAPLVNMPQRRIGIPAAILAIFSTLFVPIAPAQAACNTVATTTTCSGTMSGASVGSSGDYIFDSTVNWDNFGLGNQANPLPESFLFQSGATVTSGTVRSIAAPQTVDVIIQQSANINVHWQVSGIDGWTFNIAGTSGPIDTLNSSGRAAVTVSGIVRNDGSSTVSAIGGHKTVLPANFSLMTGSIDILSGGLVESTSSMEAIFMRGSGVEVTNAGTIMGNVSLGSNATLTNNAQLTGSVTTEGGATISNSGTITGNVTTGTGSTLELFTGGALNGTSITLGGTASDTFALNGSGSGSFILSKLSGVGAVEKRGTGDWTVSGALSGTPNWTVQAGSLAMNGSSAGTMTVDSGATLGGSGSIGTLINNGFLAPGNSIGTLTVNGNATLQNAGTYVVEISGTQSDKLVVNGAASLGGALNIQALGSSFGFSTPYTILTATGGVSGTFSSITDNSAFLDPSVTYNANDVRLTMTRNAVNFADVVRGGAPGSLARVFDNIGVGATGDMINLFNAIFSLSSPETQNVFQQLSGVTLTAPRAAIASGGAKFDSTVLSNAGRGPGQSSPGFAAPGRFFTETADTFGTTGLSNDAGYLGYSGSELSKVGELMNNIGPLLSATPMQGDEGVGFWVAGYGIGGSIRDTADAPGFVYRGGGVLSGADYRWSDETLIGLALGYGASKIDHQNSSGEGQIGSIQASLYALQTPKGYDGRLKLDGALGIARHSIEAERHLVFGGLDRMASSDHEAYELSARAGARYALNTGSAWLVEPTVSLAYSKTYEDGYTETGAGAANLTVSGDESDSFISRIGARFARSYQDDMQRLWQPEASLAWRHEFADTARSMDAAFAGVTSPFRVQGSAADRDAVELGLGINLATADEIFYALNYSATLSDNETGHGLFANVRFAW